jgi:hypothetical protein
VKSFDEVVFVDWNSKTPTLHKIKDHIFQTNKLQHIIVNPEQVQKITSNNPDVPHCCEVLARNIGLRRCTGDILVATNIDIICPPRHIIDQQDFNPNTFYTVPRINFVLDEILPYNNIKDILTHLLTHQQQYRREEIWHLEHQFGVATDNNYSLVCCCGDFQIASKNIWYTMKGFEESMLYRNYADTNVQIKAVKNGFRLKALPSLPVFHIQHPNRLGNWKQNSAAKYGYNFSQTENSDNWGCVDYQFEQEVI